MVVILEWLRSRPRGNYYSKITDEMCVIAPDSEILQTNPEDFIEIPDFETIGASERDIAFIKQQKQTKATREILTLYVSQDVNAIKKLKDYLNESEIYDHFFHFCDKWEAQAAINWCETNGIPYTKKGLDQYLHKGYGRYMTTF